MLWGFCRESRLPVVVFPKRLMWLRRAIRQIAGNASAPSFRRIDLQTTADHLGSVLHDVMAEAVFQFRLNRKSDPVISYPHNHPLSRLFQFDHNFPSLRMLVGIDYSFARDPIELRCGCVILDMK